MQRMLDMVELMDGAPIFRGEAVKRQQGQFLARLIDAGDRNVAPGSAEAAELVATHRATIARFYDTTASKQVMLARMYTADERFNASYQGHADYLLALVEKQAEKEGVDLADVRWE